MFPAISRVFFAAVLLAAFPGHESSRAQTSAVPQTGGSAASPAAGTQAPATRETGAQLYVRYCSTCHGVNGEGHLAERANALRSPSFLSTVSDNFLSYSIQYGRAGTAMSGYSQRVGGPLTDREIRLIMRHIRTLSDVAPAERSNRPLGDPARGAQVYRQHCESCHGPTGRAVTAPSLNDPMFLSVADVEFLRHAVSQGREQTAMPAFRTVLAPEQLDDVVAHIRSWSKEWVEPKPVRLMSMHLGEGVINQAGPAPVFGPMREDRYITPTMLHEALEKKSRLLLVDARPTSAWGESHIPGAVPFPYYDIVPKVGELPTDGTWIVAYCACPTALANTLVDALRTRGFKNTAVLEEGFLGWIARRYPLQSGIVEGDASSHP